MMMLRKEKRNILDKVMETETYRVAKELLEKYDPATLAKDKSAQAREWKMPNQTLLVQRGAINASLLAPNTPRPVSGSNTPPNITGIPIQGTPVRLPPALTCGSAMPNTPIRPVPFSVSPVIRGPAAVSSLTRPIAPQDRSIVEKMVDYMIGDGPNNRYALICTHCASHNGMALKEEFEFLAFRCCYCMGFNPARKQKPMAPRLAQHYQLTAQAHNATITSATQRETAPLHVDEPESENEGSDKLKIEDVTSLFGADRMEVEEEAVVSSSDDGRENLRTLEVESQSKQTEVCQNATLPLEDKDDLEFIDKEEAQNT